MEKSLSYRLSNGLLIFFLTIIVGLSAIKLLFPAENYRQEIAQKLTEISGFPVQVNGELEWFLSPLPSLYIEEVHLDQLDINLNRVNISFSLIDLLLLQGSPSSVEIERLIPGRRMPHIPELKQMAINFDEPQATPTSLSFLINRPSSAGRSPNQSSLETAAHQQDIPLSFTAVIQRPQPNTFVIDGGLSSGVEIEIQLIISELLTSLDFSVNLEAPAISASSKGKLHRTSESISIEIAQLTTPHLQLSGRTHWLSSNAGIESQFYSQSLQIPDYCFSKNAPLDAPRCHDLALLMMLPGANHIQVASLNLFDHKAENVAFNWQTTDEKLTISQLVADAYDGKFNLNASYQIRSGQWDVELNGEGIKIEDFLTPLTEQPQLFGQGAVKLVGSGTLNDPLPVNYSLSGNIEITNGRTELFNLEKELCKQVKGVVVSDLTATPFNTLTAGIELQNGQLQIKHFSTQLEGANISGQGALSPDNILQLAMNVNVERHEWNLCRLPRALTAVEWPLTCSKPLNGRGACNVNIKQMGLSALLLADDAETKEKAKQKVEALKNSDKVKKVLGRLEQWLNE